MSPWTALLESLHSALIDELNERLPDLKPELGMPIRQKAFAFPGTELPATLLCEVSFLVSGTAAPSPARGFAMLGLDAACEKKLGLTTSEFWNAIIKRAGSDFHRRGIAPRLSNPDLLENEPNAALPRNYALPARVIWIPFRLHPGICILGLGA